MYDFEGQVKRFGFAPVVSLMVTAFFPVVVASSIWFGIDSAPNGWSVRNWSLLWGFTALVLLFVKGLAVTYILAKKVMKDGVGKESAEKDFWNQLFMGNMLLFRRRLVGVVKTIPYLWFVMIKFFIPQVLLLLFINLCATTDKTSGKPNFGGYGGYSASYQAPGIFVFCACALVIIIGLVLPSAYNCFTTKQVDEEPHTRAVIDKTENGETCTEIEIAGTADDSGLLVGEV